MAASTSETTHRATERYTTMRDSTQGASGRVRSTGSRYRVFTDEQWARIDPLLPSNQGRRGHPFGEHRRVVEGIAFRYRTGIPWRDLPREQFGPWQTVWKRHRRYAADGTWDRVLTQVLAEADAAGMIDWSVSVDATISRAHETDSYLV